MPRYVVLRHECPPGFSRESHWDLMLEMGDSLRTWALPEEPVPGSPQVGEALGNHRLDYLTLEGPLSDDRGSVAQWDAGSYELLHEDDDNLIVRLEGKQLGGRAVLTRQAGDPQRWRFVCSSD